MSVISNVGLGLLACRLYEVGNSIERIPYAGISSDAIRVK
jgi:hypothetical protein